RPAKNAPTAQPSSIEATSKPISAALEWKASFRPSTVPLITPLSKPNRNPPRVATQLICTISRVFSVRFSGPAASSVALYMSTKGSPLVCMRSPRCPASLPMPDALRAQQELVDQVLVALLLAAAMDRFAMRDRMGAQVFHAQPAFGKRA